MNLINEETPVRDLNVGQLLDVIQQVLLPKEQPIHKDYSDKKYAFGLKGIREEFNVSHATAQKYKDGILKDAVTQYGRKIIVDVEMARELFAKSGRGL